MTSLQTIRFASFLGDNALDFYRQLVAYLGEKTGLPTEIVLNLSPEEQEAQVEREEIQVVFTCGLPYVLKADQNPPRLHLLAAPVLAGERYDDQPIYFSDVIVRADSGYHTFADLRGARLAYNEVYSFSGYKSLRHHLQRQGETLQFFSHCLPSGSHALSMGWVEQGRADTAAIDSVVLAMEFRQSPDRATRFRVIERLGPYPMPPIAAVSGLPVPIRAKLQDELLRMHTTDTGKRLLQEAGLRRFHPVIDAHYDPIRRVLSDLEVV